jgi:hypothetical protein
MIQIKKWLSFIATAIILLIGSQNANAASIPPLTVGDIVVSQQSSGGIYKINPTSGAVSQITTGGLLFNPMHLVVDYSGQIYAAERGYYGNTPGIIKIDPATGQQQMLATFGYPTAINFDLDRNLVVGSGKTLTKVNPSNGTKTTIGTVNVTNLQDIEVDSSGNVVVLDSGTYPSGGGKIVRFNPQTSTQSVISIGGMLRNPGDLLILPSGNYLVANGNEGNLIEVNSVTGAQQIFKDIGAEGWITLENNASIVFADFDKQVSIERIGLPDGSIQNITRNGFGNGNLTGVSVFSIPEPSTIIITMIMASFVAYRCRIKKTTNRTQIHTA